MKKFGLVYESGGDAVLRVRVGFPTADAQQRVPTH